MSLEIGLRHVDGVGEQELCRAYTLMPDEAAFEAILGADMSIPNSTG
jgi:hypothetical protein